jgi:hypothetical protein
LFLLGIFVHRLFCVPTTIDKLVFPPGNIFQQRTLYAQ